MNKLTTIQMDPEAHNLMVRIRSAIVERNKNRAVDGRFDEYENATYKAIIQRGIAAVAREVLETI